MQDLTKILAAIGLPILGAIAIELLRIFGNKAKENLNPAIAVLKPYFGVIDAIINALPPQHLANIIDNPVAAIVPELLKTQDKDLTSEQVAAAVKWASAAFNFNVHETFDPENLDREQQILTSRVTNQLLSKLSGAKPA